MDYSELFRWLEQLEFILDFGDAGERHINYVQATDLDWASGRVTRSQSSRQSVPCLAAFRAGRAPWRSA